MATSQQPTHKKGTKAAAEFQIARVSQDRHLDEAFVRHLVSRHTLERQFGFLGEPRVNVLELNRDLDVSTKTTH
ncbi:MAG TPA: potassium-transporting ATPase subunit C [Terracidiphilus sp.]